MHLDGITIELNSKLRRIINQNIYIQKNNFKLLNIFRNVVISLIFKWNIYCVPSNHMN